MCECCVRLDIQLQREDLDEDERKHLLLEKKTHLDAAIEQRRFVFTFVKKFVKQHAPTQPIPDKIIPDQYDDDRGEAFRNSDDASPTIQIQIEDFGGSFAMPHYFHSRPSAD